MSIKSIAQHLRRALQAVREPENLPYAILGGLMLFSLLSRLILILR
ncbi:MAG: hypothetical protein HYV95_16280 [Opitutae bacterium]|nr:hypothetical protein [Opitutae bacterium]